MDEQPRPLDELRAQRNALGDEIRARHIALERGASKMSEAEAHKAAHEVAALEKQWKGLNAQVRDLETG